MVGVMGGRGGWEGEVDGRERGREDAKPNTGTCRHNIQFTGMLKM